MWGLPLGINVVARTMKGIDDIRQWRHNINKFEMGQELVEKCFNNLTEKGLYSCFLFCALLSTII